MCEANALPLTTADSFYIVLTSNHPSGKKSLKFTQLQPFEHIQSTNIRIKDELGDITILSIYCPPKHIIRSDEFCNYLKTLGDRFLVGGDFNAKHDAIRCHTSSNMFPP